jgi:hypothetical protein
MMVCRAGLSVTVHGGSDEGCNSDEKALVPMDASRCRTQLHLECYAAALIADRCRNKLQHCKNANVIGFNKLRLCHAVR